MSAMDNLDQTDTSEHSRGVALALAAVIGVFGAHRFYLGKHKTGVCMALTFGGLGVWYLYDLITIASGVFRDGEGKRVTEWGVQEPGRPAPRISGERMELLLDDVDGLRHEMGELQERIDFMERMLTSVREREPIPPPSSSL